MPFHACSLPLRHSCCSGSWLPPCARAGRCCMPPVLLCIWRWPACMPLIAPFSSLLPSPCRPHGWPPRPGEEGRPPARLLHLLLERAHCRQPAVAGRHDRCRRQPRAVSDALPMLICDLVGCTTRNATGCTAPPAHACCALHAASPAHHGTPAQPPPPDPHPQPALPAHAHCALPPPLCRCRSRDGLAAALGEEFELVSEAELPYALRSCERMYSVSGPASLICCSGDSMRRDGME